MASLPEVVIGCISGTSMDGIDVCAVKIKHLKDKENSYIIPDIIGHMTHPYPSGLKEQLLSISTVQEVILYNSLIGQLFVEAVHELLNALNISKDQVLVIGSHGQTVYHIPEYSKQLFGHNVRGSLQIGDPSVIANLTDITTVGDFRTGDMSLGGQGAPLVPYLDSLLLKHHFITTGRLGVFLNIGGITNIYTQDIKGWCTGFDCGPGNVLIDGLMSRLYGAEFDEDGNMAVKGTINTQLLAWLMEDEFVLRKPPKSTGRELYSEAYIDRILDKCKEKGINQQDTISTVTAFTVSAMWYNFSQYVQEFINDRIEQGTVDLFVSGGGYKNNTLMKLLKEKFQLLRVVSSDELGIPSDAKEAVCFAVLAYQTIHGQLNSIPEVTGAIKSTVLGKICLVGDHKQLPPLYSVSNV